MYILYIVVFIRG